VVTGHVEKRAKSSWSLVIDLGRDPATGKRLRIRRSVKGVTKRQAEAELRRLIGEIEQGTYIAATKLTLGEYLQRWLEDSAAQRVRPKTLRDYRLLVERHIAPALGHIPLSALQPLHLQELYTQALQDGRLDGKGGLSPRSVQILHTVLHSALKQAVRWQIISRNPADAVDVPRPRRPQITTLDSKGLERLLQAAQGHRDEALIRFAVLTGLRRGELLALAWDDVDLDKGLLRVRRGLIYVPGGSATVDTPKTRRSRRQVVLSKAAVSVLRQVRREQAQARLRLGAGYHDHGLVFCNPDGSPMDPGAVTHRFTKLVRAAGLEGLRFHDLRHTHASLLLAQGVHPKVVQERLGHETVSTTLDTYSHVIPTLQREAAEAIDAALGHRLGTGKSERPRQA